MIFINLDLENFSGKSNKKFTFRFTDPRWIFVWNFFQYIHNWVSNNLENLENIHFLINLVTQSRIIIQFEKLHLFLKKLKLRALKFHHLKFSVLYIKVFKIFFIFKIFGPLIFKRKFERINFLFSKIFFPFQILSAFNFKNFRI